VPYSPLGRGFLTGSIRSFEDLDQDDARRNFPRFQGENFQRNLELVDAVKQMATEKDCTPAQLAIAWLLYRGDDIVPIPGTKHVGYLVDNIGALEVSIDEKELARLDEISPIGVASGERYHEQGMSSVNH
jgi:aryl-alcohol dehydrogenase-like predicted oxidoreductase